MEKLRIQDQKITLVDQVEQRLISYFKERGFRPGDSLPHEIELADALGVARSVLREALSRFKMTGMIESRTRRGMTLAEPSIAKAFKQTINPLLMTETTLLDLLEFRMALEIGISSSIFRNITSEDIADLEEIVKMGAVISDNKYAPISEFNFHTKLYEITGNKTICQFQEIIHPVMEFVKDRHHDYFGPIAHDLKEKGEVVTHEDLLGFLKSGDKEGYDKAIRLHFKLYTDFMMKRKVEMQNLNESNYATMSGVSDNSDFGNRQDLYQNY